MRIGVVYLIVSDGNFIGAGQSGGYWSSYGNNATNAYNPGFNASLVYPSHGPWERYYGRPLRCLSTVLEM